MFPETHPFEFDDDVDHEEIDAGGYEALMTDQGLDDEDEGDAASPAWGRWPNYNNLGGPGWTPLPTHGGLRSGSIISISPRGSVSHSRRGSAPASKLSDTASRRSSTANSLGLMDQRRRSSAKSQVSARRRSSVMSNGSAYDPVEEERIRRFARIDVLARRFSELVEVISPCPGDDEGLDDVARAREMISRWSPFSTETDVSEVRTMSYVPTPQSEPPVPALLSNFPLSSVAREYTLNTPDDLDLPVFPGVNPRSPVEYTPPPPVEPADQLRRRSRPGLARALTDFTFPSRSTVSAMPHVSLAAARPVSRRVVSTPLLPETGAGPLDKPPTELDPPTEPKEIQPRRPVPTGSFPLARSQPIGLSRLRESTRRPSASSEKQQSRRPSIVAERRMSIVEQGSSRALLSRKTSRDLSPKSSRKTSFEAGQHSLSVPRKSSSGSDLRRESLDPDRRSSAASRKSSIVSLGEYRYLANEIDTPIPSVPSKDAATSSLKSDSLGARRNAPPAIVLPPYQFPSPHSTALASPGSANPRYNPLDTFLGRSTPGLISSDGASLSSLSPDSDLSSPKTPGLHRSVLDRGRPIASPEFQDSFPLRSSHAPFANSGTASTSGTPNVKETDKTKRSPSYRFPVIHDPSFSQDTVPPVVQITPAAQAPVQPPLKSILIKHAPSPSRPLVTEPRALPRRSIATKSDTERDIQVFLRARRELKEAAAPGLIAAAESKQVRPAMTRHSSFTRLFQRAKAQSSPTS